ncbi:hypothetical protein P8452_52238 [Trifolium repens]|nr:protein root UVB sensitive 1, chloroplastic [Trifolium repens]KAK2457957.1 protein root UVB sensitive 1, chloroplastic [Trifolium repens]WJX67801.1 hypothetical protein P8452_52238 [Trifolium repens]
MQSTNQGRIKHGCRWISLTADVTFKGFYQELFLYGFAAQRNFAEVIVKGEVQGMASRFIGIKLDIELDDE